MPMRCRELLVEGVGIGQILMNPMRWGEMERNYPGIWKCWKSHKTTISSNKCQCCPCLNIIYHYLMGQCNYFQSQNPIQNDKASKIITINYFEFFAWPLQARYQYWYEYLSLVSIGMNPQSDMVIGMAVLVENQWCSGKSRKFHYVQTNNFNIGLIYLSK